jgi:hypothetical protein
MAMKINQDKIPSTLDTSGNLHMDQLEDLAELLTQGKPNWKLVRKGDGLTKHSVDVIWIEFNENGTFKAKHNEPAVGRSLLMSPFNQFFTWQCTSLTEIVEEQDDYIKFKTQNSNYKLWKLKNN